MPPTSSSASHSSFGTPFQKRIIPGLIIGFQLLALVAFVMAPFLALSWFRLPFIGSFVENTRMLAQTSPSRPGTWELQKLNLEFGHQIVAIDGVQLTSHQQMFDILRGRQVGDQVQITLRAPTGKTTDHVITLTTFPLLDRLAYFVVLYLIGLAFFVCGIYVFMVRRQDVAGRSFAIFSTAAALGTMCLFDLYTTNRLTYFWTLGVGLTGGGLISLAMVFPTELGIVRRYPVLRWIGPVLGLGVALLAFPTLFDLAHPLAYVQAWFREYILAGIGALLFIAKVTYRHFTTVSPVAREQTRLMLWGTFVAFAPMAFWLLANPFLGDLTFSPLYMLPLVLFPVAIGYAILRYRMLNTDFMMNRLVLYGILTILAAIGYALLVSAFSLLAGNVFQPTNPYLIGVMVFMVALLLEPVRSRLQGVVDQVFFRGQIAYRNRLQTFGRELTQALDLTSIIGLLRQYTTNALLPAPLHIFVYDPLSDQYAAIADEHGSPTTDVRFSSNSALVKSLGREQEAIFLSKDEPVPPELEAEQVRLALLGSQLFMPLPGRKALIGWMALGPRQSGEPYSNRDLAFLESLSDQAALAVERAQVMADLERRMREMNVLARVAQGTNFTVSYDDILELIYAQTNQVIPVRDFWITLEDKDASILYHAFFLVNDERLAEKENQPLLSGGLEGDVIINQRAFLTDDYERECRNRSFSPNAQGTYAWMGVPLNAGATTIGAISLASRDPTIIYTEEQRNLLQAIADQTSGAIVKARLLQESERRARQLATLNEIGRSLTSTLELKPLLQQILKSATEILNCAAGSLFLVDEQTGELVFEVVIGPVAHTLVGRRLPPGKGVVGEAVVTGHPIIANDAKRRKEWFAKPDSQTGFDTQDLLVVPMMVQDRVIGVIEVINKQDGAPFNASDQNLLATFTSQATIAIENARLYTMTDQALAARVEELQVMQRIDRELNASLEVDRALRITLDWAMRQSTMDAGYVGFVEEDGLRIMVSQGYTTEIAPFQAAPDAEKRNGNTRLLPMNMPGLQSAFQTAQPQALRLADVGSSEEHPFGLLNSGRSQIIIPIRREAEVSGVLVLESRSPDLPAEDMMAFLSRLMDHAAIAIANAQLYAEVQAANLAKSQFVSFVAHELKNPMASIKGYTELVIKGMAGPINELQSGFLNTVRNNVDRMNTIVTDLNDLTKIQVGALHLEFKAAQMAETIDDVVRSLNQAMQEKDLHLHMAVPADLPLVWADSNRLAQILTNLVSNATKYTLQGGDIYVSAEYCKMEGQNPAAGLMDVVHFWVKDTGIGIPPEDQGKIFQSYFRTAISKDTASGTGLGLNITRNLVEMQGGRIWFESELNKGTTFHITIPVAEAA